MIDWLWVAALISSATANAQVTSVTDPNALRPDPKASQAVAEASTTQQAPPVAPTQIAPAPSSVAPTQSAGPLNLTCGGGGSANKVAVANAYGWNSYGGSSQATVWGSRSQGFADQVDVRLFSGDDRIRMPRTMLPPIHGGSDGWFKLKNVKVTERAITASAGINFLNNPKIHIDRLTGTISINGRAGSYTGQCEAVDPNAQRKF